MATYVAFLRAVNLGARRKFPRDDLRAVTEAAGFEQVDTYLNTGNVRLSTRMRSLDRVSEKLEAAYAADRGFEVPTIVFGQVELREVSAYAGQLGEQVGPFQRHHVCLLRQELPAPLAAEVSDRSTDQVQVAVQGRAINLMWTHATPGDVDPLGASLSRALGVSTARTSKVLAELVRRWC